MSIMFNIPFVILKCDNWKHKKQKLIELSASQTMFRDKTIKTDFFNNLGNLYCEEISSLFKDEIETAYNQLKITEKMKLSQAWFEFAEKGMHHPIHNHGAIGYSAICYLEYSPKLHTATTFIAPYNNFIDGQTLDVTLDVAEGSIVFFPSVIHHYSMPNQSDTVRKILSFNLLPVYE